MGLMGSNLYDLRISCSAETLCYGLFRGRMLAHLRIRMNGSAVGVFPGHQRF